MHSVTSKQVQRQGSVFPTDDATSSHEGGRYLSPARRLHRSNSGTSAIHAFALGARVQNMYCTFVTRLGVERGNDRSKILGGRYPTKIGNTRMFLSVSKYSFDINPVAAKSFYSPCLVVRTFRT